MTYEIQIDRRNGAGWTTDSIAITPDSNVFETEAEAEAEIEELARCLECDPSDLRVAVIDPD